MRTQEKFLELIKKYPNDSELGEAIRLATLVSNFEITNAHAISKADKDILDIINIRNTQVKG
jgi:hypothetical protein